VRTEIAVYTPKTKKIFVPKKKDIVLTGYRFLQKDPIIDLYREAKRRSGMKELEISAICGVTLQTLRNWDFGKTRKPQHLTVRFALAALGIEEQYIDTKTGAVIQATYAVHKSKK
jgi:hypothetical protein